MAHSLLVVLYHRKTNAPYMFNIFSKNSNYPLITVTLAKELRQESYFLSRQAPPTPDNCDRLMVCGRIKLLKFSVSANMKGVWSKTQIVQKNQHICIVYAIK
jgi:hypothetical protein